MVVKLLDSISFENRVLKLLNEPEKSNPWIHKHRNKNN